MADLYDYIFGKKNPSPPPQKGEKDKSVKEDQLVTQPARSADAVRREPPPMGSRNPANREALEAAGMADGGPVKGPGTGTSDSIPAKLSNGEFVIPADVVSFLGVKFFNDLIGNAKSEMGTAEPTDNPFTEMAEEDDVMPQGMKAGGYVIGRRRGC